MNARLLTLALLLTVACGTAAKRNADTAPIIREHAHEISGAANDYDALLQSIGSSRVVLLGEATHGTHEFYRERTRITERLIRERGFNSIALEANWSDAERLDQFVRGKGKDRSAAEALEAFTNFPRWMWRNRDVVELLDLIRAYNDGKPADAQVRIHGLDLYGFDESIIRAQEELQKIDPALAESARKRYECISRYAAEPDRYARVATQRCAQSVASIFGEVLKLRTNSSLSPELRDALFSAEQNARVVKNAEEYHRESATGRVSTWNIRDRHMLEMLSGIDHHRATAAARPKIVLWAHNSHVGDARATSMGAHEEWNIGQLLREVPNLQSYSVGFTTNSGTVFAAHNWGGEGSVRTLRPAIPESFCRAFHETGLRAFYVLLRDPSLTALFNEPRMQRAVGVIYRPDSELASHYFRTRLSSQFDAVIHIDQTTAVEPLR